MILWIGIGIIIALVIRIGSWMFQKGDPEYILKFLKENAKNKNVALSVKYNKEKWVEVNGREPLPLASTVKMIVAIAYAKQAADGRIDPQQNVTFKELNTYYVPKTDGGAHEAWLDSVKKDKEINSVPLSEVAKGMIAYSSNANTDYLIQVLGLENINRVLKELNVTDHEPIYPMVSTLFIPLQLMREKNITKEETLQALKEMDMDEYRNQAIAIHQQWLNELPSDEEKQQLVKIMDMDFQKVWSDRLSRATTDDYVSIIEKLNSKTLFSKSVHEYLDPIMESLMNNPKNREWLVHGGQKSGSTVFVLTMAMYATDKQGNQTELAFFANDLSLLEQKKLSLNMNSFQLKFLTNDEFRRRVQKELAF
ncbi:serine hydrolase [Bacillus sp. FJAT-52991]|uniref:Serine hydrolase n=1 Tax=Bacillus kandeliae TaxID=3129297 RepID=A0ABZ2NB34_9BACI